ncbi:uncharacterized protein MONOS_17262 [Monocercomonoides exilis]|uniref:uncharacterized protein n=1 Tax=Monocercomonoides exilis TaxID=2049356 RepID=UPI003559C7FA|nr:hypothetical protein MONOS_17262 [Monocercomonoides exilis]
MSGLIIQPLSQPVGFTKTAEGKYQYNFTDPELTDKKRYRPIAYRMSFLLDPNFTIRITQYPIYAIIPYVIIGNTILRPLKPINQGMAVQVVPIATI